MFSFLAALWRSSTCLPGMLARDRPNALAARPGAVPLARSGTYRTRTGTPLPARDFKSPASAVSPRCLELLSFPFGALGPSVPLGGQILPGVSGISVNPIIYRDLTDECNSASIIFLLVDYLLDGI